MGRYRSYGTLDDPHASDGDMAFVRWISRINPEQLGTGEVAYSQNGRMDNDRSWQPRKGTDVFSPVLDTGAALLYPFNYDDSSPPSYNDKDVNGVYGTCYVVDPATELEYLLVVTNTKAIAISLADPTTTYDVAYPSGTIYYQVEVIQALDKVFIFRGSEGTTWEWDGDVSGTPAFTAVASGAYSALSVDNTTSNASIADGIVTITETSHGRSTGDVIEIYDADNSGLVAGDRYEIVKVDDDNYTFNASVEDGTYSLTLGAKVPVSGGYIHMPDAEWGIYHQGRLILPYTSSLTTGESRDEIIFSDIFDSDTFDPIIHQLRFASGSADYVVGAAPLFNDRLIVFCRNSVHVVDGVSGELSDLSVTEITREVGCMARKTIVEVGGSILFLSDQGVYNITYGQELNLIANSIPLSEPIENYIRSINWQYASNAIAAYADNRYYLAVPLGSSTVNNAIFVYNFLNQGWESLDTFPRDLDIKDMLVMPYEGKNRLFLVNKVGAVHLTEAQEEYDYYQQYADNTFQQAIRGKMITRRHMMGNMDIKRFNRATILAENPVSDVPRNIPDEYTPEGSSARGGTLGISFTTVDPDHAVNAAKTLTLADGEDYNAKVSLRKRGYGLQLIFDTSVAKVRGYEVQAITSSRNHVDRS